MSDQEETENRWKHDIIWFRSQIWYDIIIWYEISNRRWCLHNFKVALHSATSGSLIDYFPKKATFLDFTGFSKTNQKYRKAIWFVGERNQIKKKRGIVEQTLTLAETTLYQICLGFEIGVFSAFVISFHW